MVNGDFVFPICRYLSGNKLTGAVPHSLKEKSNSGQLQLRFGYHLQRLQLICMLIKQSRNKEESENKLYKSIFFACLYEFKELSN
jgi:hypothetical protein